MNILNEDKEAEFLSKNAFNNQNEAIKAEFLSKNGIFPFKNWKLEYSEWS